MTTYKNTAMVLDHLRLSLKKFQLRKLFKRDTDCFLKEFWAKSCKRLLSARVRNIFSIFQIQIVFIVIMVFLDFIKFVNSLIFKDSFKVVFDFVSLCTAVRSPKKKSGRDVCVMGSLIVFRNYLAYISGAPAREARQRSTMGKEFW